MTDNEAGPPHNRDAVLTAIGRAATPPVPKVDNGPSLGALTGANRLVDPGCVLFVGTTALADRIQEHRSAVPGVPGMLTEIAANPSVETFIVEGRAFRTGPWIGADDHQSRHLAEEIFEAGRILRARGGQAWFVPTAELRGSMSARVLSTFTARLDEIPDDDLEEGAAQSKLWSALIELSHNSQPDVQVQRSRHERPKHDGNDTVIRASEPPK